MSNSIGPMFGPSGYNAPEPVSNVSKSSKAEMPEPAPGLNASSNRTTFSQFRENAAMLNQKALSDSALGKVSQKIATTQAPPQMLSFYHHLEL